jgi:hypothetical protein
MQGGSATQELFHVHEMYKAYLNSEVGSVPWQANKINAYIIT